MCRWAINAIRSTAPLCYCIPQRAHHGTAMLCGVRPGYSTDLTSSACKTSSHQSSSLSTTVLQVSTMARQAHICIIISAIIACIRPTISQGTCSPSQSCGQGCCSSSGFCGFGPSFCGAGNCTSSCDALAECGQYAPTNRTSCPLNVCCSEFGYCGTTAEFCGSGCQSGCEPVQQPACGTTPSYRRRIGYYESWNPSRPCDVWQPEDINPFSWTHINYAFALIDKEFRLAQANTWDTSFYSKLMALKDQNSELRIFISIGGWDAGGQIFSQMVSTEANRLAFINSVLSFLVTYGFDGVDIDWVSRSFGHDG